MFHFLCVLCGLDNLQVTSSRKGVSVSWQSFCSAPVFPAAFRGYFLTDKMLLRRLAWLPTVAV